MEKMIYEFYTMWFKFLDSLLNTKYVERDRRKFVKVLVPTAKAIFIQFDVYNVSQHFMMSRLGLHNGDMI